MLAAATDAATPALAPVSRAMRRMGQVITAFVALFLLFDAAIKLIRLPIVDETMARLGWPVELSPAIGALELAILALYLVPRTAPLGAILLTGVLGGAIATHLRIADPLFSHVLFGLYLGALAWGEVWLRDERLRALLPWRR